MVDNAIIIIKEMIKIFNYRVPEFHLVELNPQCHAFCLIRHELWLWTTHNVIFAAGSSEVQFVILQGSARPEVRSELYEELKARIWHSHPSGYTVFTCRGENRCDNYLYAHPLLIVSSNWTKRRLNGRQRSCEVSREFINNSLNLLSFEH